MFNNEFIFQNELLVSTKKQWRGKKLTLILFERCVWNPPLKNLSSWLYDGIICNLSVLFYSDCIDWTTMMLLLEFQTMQVSEQVQGDFRSEKV